jgi:hypothetical protein
MQMAAYGPSIAALQKIAAWMETDTKARALNAAPADVPGWS